MMSRKTDFFSWRDCRHHPLTQFLHGTFGGVVGFTIVAGTFAGVGVGDGAGVFVACAEVPEVLEPGPRNERHPADSRQAASSRASIMNTVEVFIVGVFSPGLLKVF
jgi:hypothetical protein